MAEIINFLVISTMILAAVVFSCAVLKWFLDTLEEWEDIINSARDEK